MRLLVISLFMLIAVVLCVSCGDSATEITGTLPMVTGITVDSLASRGDTVIVTWNEVSGVEGYYLWSRVKIDDPWCLLETTDMNNAQHITDRSAVYTVMAFDGDNTSSATGIPDDSRADDLIEIQSFISPRLPIAFRVDPLGDSLISGDPTSAIFQQHFTVTFDISGTVLFVYPGTAHPDIWPGGAMTMISDLGGFVAPARQDSTMWRDSILFVGDFFLALENGYYCKLSGSLAGPDSLLQSDSLAISGQLQPIVNLRLFNQTW